MGIIFSDGIKTYAPKPTDSKAYVGSAQVFDYKTKESTHPHTFYQNWLKPLFFDAMKNPRANIMVATRYMRRVGDAAYNLYKPDARESLMLDDKSLIPSQHIRWADEFDWGKLRNYLRNHLLWHHSYEFDISEFEPSDDRLNELNMMILYSEYRTSPPFDGSWFFEGMYLVRETRRWLNSREDILDQLEPLDGKLTPFMEYIEDYSFYQNEYEMLNPGRMQPKNEEVEKSEDDKGESEKENDNDNDKPKDEKKGKRKSRGRFG